MGFIYVLMAGLSTGFIWLCGFDLKTAIICGILIGAVYGLLDTIPWESLKGFNVKNYIITTVIVMVLVGGALCIKGATNLNLKPLFLSGVKIVKISGTETVVPRDWDFSSPGGEIFKELAIVVGHNGYGEFLAYGHMVSRGGEKYWVFNSGEEFKISSFSDNPLTFRNIIVREGGFWHKKKCAEAKGHLAKAKWLVGSPEKGKIMNLNAKHVWNKWF